MLEALNEPVDLGTIKASVEELTGQILRSWRRVAGIAVRPPRPQRVRLPDTQVLGHPHPLEKAAWGPRRGSAQAGCPRATGPTAELLTYLMLGAAAQKGGESLLRPKVHFFLRGLDEMVVALGGEPSAPKVDLFLSLSDAKERHAGRHDDAFFPVLVCRAAASISSRALPGARIRPRGRRTELRGFEQGNATQDDEGTENASGPTAPAENGHPIGPDEPAAGGGGQEGQPPRSARWPRGHCSAASAGRCTGSQRTRCLADGCGHKEPLLPLMAFGARLSACPSCSTPRYADRRPEIEPARKVQAVTVSDVHILAQAMINAAPEGHKKLIIFADSRQDAAFQAGWMQDHARRIRLRHMMNQVISDAKAPLTLDDITDKLMEIFRKDQNLIDTLLPELTGEEAPATFRPQQDGCRSTEPCDTWCCGSSRPASAARTAWSRWAWLGSPTTDLSTDQPGLRHWAEVIGMDRRRGGRGDLADPRQLAAQPNPLRHRRSDLSPDTTPRMIRTSRRACNPG